MLTDFQKRKLNALFDLYDVNKDGFVEQADFEHIVQNLANLLGRIFVMVQKRDKTAYGAFEINIVLP